MLRHQNRRTREPPRLIARVLVEPRRSAPSHQSLLLLLSPTNDSSVPISTEGTIRLQFTFHTVAGRITRSLGPRHRVCRSSSTPATIFTGVAPREVLVDSRLILRWSRMPNWSSNASREMAPPGRSLYASTRAESSTSAIGSPAIEPKPRIWRRTSSSGFTELWAATVQFTAALQLG
jgi:hypothetical protein